MTWLAPWALLGGALGMLGIVAAHLLSRQRPRALALATARFLPSGMLEATTLQRVPQDRWWMLLRLLIVALVAMAVAQPVLTGSKVPTRTVLLLDRTLPVTAQREVMNTLREADVVVAFDSVATLQSVAAVAPVQAARSSLSAALGLLVRVRDSLALEATELHVVAASRFAERSFDPATRAVRTLLGDSIAIVPVSVALAPAPARGAITVRADGDDPVAATALLVGDSVAQAGTVIERRAILSGEDAAAVTRGATIVHWPARVATGVPSLQAITVGTSTWIAPLQRDTSAAPVGAHAIGWWADGAPAVWKRATDTGCQLTVHAALPAAGDHALSLAAQAWLRALVTSCDADLTAPRLAPAWFSPAPARSAANVPQQTLHSGVAPWLMVAALLLVVTELALRAAKRA